MKSLGCQMTGRVRSNEPKLEGRIQVVPNQLPFLVKTARQKLAY
jgi:hypothetical protein